MDKKKSIKDEGPKWWNTRSLLNRQSPKALEVSLNRDFEGITGVPLTEIGTPTWGFGFL